MAPVVTAALGALGPLLGKLADLLAGECSRLKGVRREIHSLQSEFKGMDGALNKYARLEDPDDQVKEWVSLVRELAYDTEDLFDKFIHRLGKGGDGEGFKEFFHKTARRLKTLGARRGIANQIDDLKLRIKLVKELKTSYKLDDIDYCTSGHTGVDPRLAALFAGEEHLVGIDSRRDELARSQSLEGMKNILSLSYNDLPPNLKTVLLHLSNFPEDYVIDRERLVRQWIAEGFISEERGRSCEEVAESYFYELINKSLVQPVNIHYDGKVQACRVHDMMLELIISKSTEENFITVVNGSQTVWENSQCSIRRLSIQDIDQELASQLAKKDLSHVRSLIITASGCIKHLPSLTKFETLRVLDFKGCWGLRDYDMDGMENLFQLKYLSFYGTDISWLPSGVVMLHDLETLDLRGTPIRDLPARIVQLTKLQHLCIYMYQRKIPIGIENMINLREIGGFDITMSSVGAVKELGSLINLRVLRVQYMWTGAESQEHKRHAEMFHSSLCKLGSYKLQSVWIDGSNSALLELLDSWSPLPSRLQRFEGITEYCFSKLPKWITPALTSLAYLNIHISVITEEVLGILGELPALLSLKLSTNRVHKDRLVLQGRGFRCLKEFFYIGGPPLFEKGALPKLEKLDLFFESMAKAYGFYLGIEHLPYLKDVRVLLLKRDGTSSEVETAEVAIRNEASLHANHPRLTLRET
ncbi:Disease resistance protein RPM1 [Triticum urartu]|uniref:Disease resistance protein RPM1 n=2 Tax=Triticum urartu TaxID=4572 RepID=M8ATR2_TRIUA|nr:Disease resistance protein RPM1 [Triticum urartu]